MATTATSPPRTGAKLRPYFPELDGVRAIAAVMVMAFHFSQEFYPSRLLIFGQTGVDLFFTLSGFLITTILLQSPPRDWHEVRNFYIRRTLRIFPLYYGYLLVATFLSTITISFWFYVENYPLAFNSPLIHGPVHFWSLAVEEQFYLVWPFLVLFWPRRWLAHAMWSAIALSTLLRILLIPTAIGVFYLTVTRLDGLAAGSLLALAYHRRTRLPRGALASGAAAFFALLVLGAAFSGGRGLAWVQVTKYSAAAGTYTCLMGLLILSSGTFIHQLLRSRPMRAIGRVSYGLYVFHPMVLGLVAAHAPGLPLPLKCLIFLFASYLISVASFYGVEKHFTDLKQRLAPEKPFPAAASV